MEQKRLGKITKCTFGYQDAMIGIAFTLDCNGLCVDDFWGYWNTSPSGAKWTDADRQYELGKIVMRIDNLLEDSKCDYVHQLIGKPVEITYQDNALKSWRILKEVL